MRHNTIARWSCALTGMLGVNALSVAQLQFTDITAKAGVGLDGTLTESVAWGDYDNDGDEDLYLTNNGANVLFRNDGGGSFTDVTTEAGVGNGEFSVGTVFADFNNDGFLDLYVVNFGSESGVLDVLYRNNGPIGPGGAYTFTDITLIAGITVDRSSRGVAVVDYDQDGLLDVYVNAIGENILYHNLGNLQFQDVAGLTSVNANDTGVGAVCSDIDNDGRVDIFTGNRSLLPNALYHNTGGSFVDITASAGIDKVGLGMGVLAFDYDNDLDMDLYWTTWPGGVEPFTPNALYRNDGGLVFTDRTTESGTADPTGWGISCNAGDVDNDRWQDFFVTNGFSATSTPNVLFHNQTDNSFSDATAALQGGGDFDGRGAAFANFDDDGDLDLVVTTGADGPIRFWRNDSINKNHWLTLKLRGTGSNRSAVGARIEVTAGGMTTVQEVSGGAGRGSFNSLPVEFGLGGASTVDQVMIRWPNGWVQTINSVAADQVVHVTEIDLDGSGSVGQSDLNRLLNRWGDPACASSAPPCPEDLDGMNGVGQTDLNLLLNAWD